MAPTDQKMKNKGKFSERKGRFSEGKGHFSEGKGKFSEGKGKQWSNRVTPGGNKKRKWVPDHKVFDGSVAEGQGFAFKRKQKFQHEYNKLLRKERRKNPEAKAVMYKDEYPEHLRHLYLAEAEKLRDEARQNRVKRSQSRMGGRQEQDEEDEDDDEAPEAPEAPTTVPDVTERSDVPSASLTPESTEAKGPGGLPMSNRMKKKMARKTSYQKTKEEFEKIKEKRKQKKEEFLTNKQQREEAIQKYKQKKAETFQMLSKKTKKGQPNFNLQMEYLLQKIQGSGK